MSELPAAVDFGLADDESPASKQIEAAARRIARSWGFGRSEADDLAQELRAHLLQRAPKFDRRRASPSTFVKRVIDNRAASLVRERRALKRGAHCSARPLQTEQGEAVDVSSSLARHHRGLHDRGDHEFASLQNDLRSLLQSLPRLQQQICALLREVPESVAAERLNLTRHRMRCELAEIRERFEEAGVSAYL